MSVDVDVILKLLGHTIRDQRDFLGLNREALSEKSGVCVNTIGRIESGKDFYLSTMLSLCSGLELTAADLWDLVEMVEVTE